MPSEMPIPQPAAGVIGADAELRIHGRLVTTTSGAVDTTNSIVPNGVTVTKTGSETGRYTFTLPRNFYRLLNIHAIAVAGDDAAYGAVSVGLIPVVRDIDIGQGAGDGTVEVQFLNASTNFTDAELPNGYSVLWTLVVDRRV